MVKLVPYSLDRKLTGVDAKGRSIPGKVGSSYRQVGPTCPRSCPMLPTPENVAAAQAAGRKLCYAKRGRVSFQEKVAAWSENDGAALERFIAEDLTPTHLFRHHVSGDLNRPDGAIDEAYLNGMLAGHQRNPGVIGWLYTHSWRDLDPSRFRVGRLCANASANDLHEAIEAKRQGWDAVVVLDKSEARKRFKHREGDTEIEVVVCPAQQTGNRVGCTTCRLCTRRDRKFVVGFLNH